MISDGWCEEVSMCGVHKFSLTKNVADNEMRNATNVLKSNGIDIQTKNVTQNIQIQILYEFTI